MKPIVFKKSSKAAAIKSTEYYIDHLDPKKEYRLEIKEHRKKRSLDANAFYWVCVHKLAEHTGISTTEIYRSSIKEIGGVSEHYCGKPEAIKRLVEEWKKQGLGWITETYESKLDGMENVTLYYGSSTYNTAQMARLIDNVIQDCKAVGIETEPQEKIDSLLANWANKKEKEFE